MQPDKLFGQKPSLAFFDLFEVLGRFTYIDWILFACMALGVLTFFVLFVSVTPARKGLLKIFNHFEGLLEKGNADVSEAGRTGKRD